MYTLPLIAGLSITGFATALTEQARNIESCSWSPLVYEDQFTCAAPLTKQRPPTLLKVETPELWNEFDERYEPPRTYQLPAPWKGPERCSTEFCLFSSPVAGEGMSLITTSRSAYIVATSKIPMSTGLEPTALYEAEIPGKGVGLIANRTIRKGEIIMQRAPALLIQSTPHLDLEPELRLEVYQAAVYRLPEVTRDRFLRQIGNNIYDKVEKNSFRIFVDGDRKHSAHLGIFPEVSKFNHDCRPNVHYRLANLTHTTVAVRDIPAGEELTISYIYGRTPRSERQSQLSEWGFTCTCSQCTLPDLESRASDIRLRQIKELEAEIERLMSRGGGGGGGMRPEMGGKLVELYLAERLDAYLAPTYTRAALIYSMFGHEEKAREYAREAAGALERETGPQATDIESMRRLAGDPKGHWSWGVMATSGKGGGERNKTEAKGK
ncbi:SET domain-containing protein 5 [Parachaetomium inaequale]|uniref:SET domain-containing protein 5 n=1 Tax=Parachaetomium inaequale TaxID=2588326 RepID=A0AAN6PK35_9PEZI|nr:SET domain-containing protein 5 [Parachaetomium inaequale]